MALEERTSRAPIYPIFVEPGQRATVRSGGSTVSSAAAPSPCASSLRGHNRNRGNGKISEACRMGIRIRNRCRGARVARRRRLQRLLIPHCASLNHSRRNGKASKAMTAKLAGANKNALRPKPMEASKVAGTSAAAASSKNNVLLKRFQVRACLLKRSQPTKGNAMATYTMAAIRCARMMTEP